jgi:hypothetical protein
MPSKWQDAGDSDRFANCLSLNFVESSLQFARLPYLHHRERRHLLHFGGAQAQTGVGLHSGATTKEYLFIFFG